MRWLAVGAFCFLRNCPTVAPPPSAAPAPPPRSCHLTPHRLDFIVVMSSLLIVVPNAPKVSGVRLLRTLRPLRSLTVLPGLKRLLSALLSSVSHLLSVAALLGFVFIIFAVLAVQVGACLGGYVSVCVWWLPLGRAPPPAGRGWIRRDQCCKTCFCRLLTFAAGVAFHAAVRCRAVPCRATPRDLPLLQLWAGVMHSRCRLTPRPIKIPDADLLVPPPGMEDARYFRLSLQYFRDLELGVGNASSEAAQYVAALVSDRTAFPFCGAGDPTGKVRRCARGVVGPEGSCMQRVVSGIPGCFAFRLGVLPAVVRDQGSAVWDSLGIPVVDTSKSAGAGLLRAPAPTCRRPYQHASPLFSRAAADLFDPVCMCVCVDPAHSCSPVSQ